VLAGLLAVSAWALPVQAESPKKGGIHKFVVPDEPPSFDGHKETTFVMIHPIAPFYSVLIRVPPEDPAKNEFVCDLCTEMPKAADEGKSFTFKIRKGVKFHDGSTLTAKDVHASFQRIIFPPKGVSSARHAWFSMVESVTAPDDETVVFKLKHPSGSFLPSLANPFNFIYSKAKIDADQHWHEMNVMGSGPFVFEARQAGALVKGKRNPDYYHNGLPYLDGFEAAKTQTLSSGDGWRPGRRRVPGGLPPKTRDVCGRARQGHHGRRATGTAPSSSHPTTRRSPSTTSACARPCRWPSIAGAAPRTLPRSPSSKPSAAWCSRAIQWRQRRQSSSSWRAIGPISTFRARKPSGS
jgi:peptide/nickel transport system substrate-binding protein